MSMLTRLLLHHKPLPHEAPPTDAFSLVLSIGIAFGSPFVGGRVTQIKNAGAAKILAMV